MSNQQSPWGNYQFGPGPSGQNPYSAPSYPGSSYQPPGAPVDGRAIASLVIGIVGLMSWCCPLIGLPLNITGIILGAISLKSPNPTSKILAIVGIVLCVLSLLASIANGVLGAIMQINNPQQNPFLR